MSNNTVHKIMKTTVVHFKKEKYDVYIGRSSDPIKGKWGNPFSHIKDRHTMAGFLVNTRNESIEAYEKWILDPFQFELLLDLPELEGKILGCWCKSKTKFISCHGDILADLCNLMTSLRITEPSVLAKTYKIKRDDLIAARLINFNKSISK